jgi:methionine aminopeptidase
MLTDKISEIDLTKYNTSSKICRIVMEELFSKIYEEDTLDVYELEKYSDKRIEEECQKIYKKEKNKGVAFPTSISLNNCAGNYRYEKDNDNYNTIKEGDVIKIELGVSISGCIGVLGETIIKLNKKDNEDGKYDDDKKINDNIKYIQLLNDLKDDVIDMIKVGEINDEIRIHVESKCIENKCFPLQNTVSYQHVNGELNSDESKYIIFNHQINENISLKTTSPVRGNTIPNPIDENICFEFEEGEVYTIQLIFTPSEDENIIFQTLHDPHIYRFNEYFYNLKLKMSREFCSIVKQKYSQNAFDCLPYKNDGKYRVGIREASEHQILENYPILYVKNGNPVFHKKFTIVIGRERTKAF